MNRSYVMDRIAKSLCGLTLAFLANAGVAADMPNSGFFDDYDKLQSADASWISSIYLSDHFEKVLSTTQAIVVPQPEIFLASNSKYKGISPDEMKSLADSFQAVIIDALADKYQIAMSPGPNTIVLRMALTGVHLKKKGRKFYQYIPTAFVLSSLKRALFDDFAKKIQLTEVAWEAEILDGSNAEVLGQLVLQMGNQSEKKEFTSWDDLITAMSVGGMRLRCRFDNASDGTDKDCFEITEADLPVQ